jgi:hypothetical protein
MLPPWEAPSLRLAALLLGAATGVHGVNVSEGIERLLSAGPCLPCTSTRWTRRALGGVSDGPSSDGSSSESVETARWSMLPLELMLPVSSTCASASAAAWSVCVCVCVCVRE